MFLVLTVLVHCVLSDKVRNVARIIYYDLQYFTYLFIKYSTEARVVLNSS